MTGRLCIISIFVAFLIIGCSKQAGLTESQIRLSEAKKAQAVLIEKANIILDTKVKGIFLEDLNHISYASEIALRAKHVFIDAKINLKSESLAALDNRIGSYVNSAGLTAVKLLHQSVDMTVSFKKDIEDMPLQPLTSNSTSTSDGMVKFLAKQYSVDIKSCCISDLKDIAIFLSQVDELEHYPLRKMIANVEVRLSSVLRQPETAEKYKNEINAVGEQYKNTQLANKR